MSDRYVLMDRDGVINDNSMYYVLSPDAFRFLPGVLQALALLCKARYRVVVVSNQSAVGKGLLSEAELHAIHRKMLAVVRAHGGDIADILYCTDTDAATSTHKKPQPGMLLDAATKHGFALGETWFIGDSLTDVEAGRRAGCKTILIGETPAETNDSPDARAADLLAAVREVVLAEDGTYD